MTMTVLFKKFREEYDVIFGLTLAFMIGISEAMSYLHSQGIIHLDLNPNNILIDDEGFPIISDFGLSKEIQKKESGMTFNASKICGTFKYIAPETWMKAEYSKACDVYSFGLIVYELLTKKDPFCKFSEPTQIVFNVAIKGYRPELKSKIPKAYRDLIELCWKQNPEERPTFDEILTILTKDDSFIIDEVSNEATRIIEFMVENNVTCKNELNAFLKILEMRSSSNWFLPEDFATEGAGASKYSNSDDESDEESEEESNDVIGDHPFHYEEIKYDENINMSSFSVDELIEYARKNNVNAMLRLGEIFYKGENVPIDKENAKKYYKQAADLGDSDGMNNYAWILIEEKDENNINQALRYFKISANKGNMAAMRNYLHLMEKIENK